VIRINWSEVEVTKIRLLQSGATNSLEMMVIVFYHNKSDCSKLQIKLGELEQVLFDLGSDEHVRAFFSTTSESRSRISSVKNRYEAVVLKLCRFRDTQT